jgi:hypothetical protein
MVSLRCKMIVKSELENMQLHHTIVELGEVEIIENLSLKMRSDLKLALAKHGPRANGGSEKHPYRENKKHHHRDDSLQR